MEGTSVLLLLVSLGFVAGYRYATRGLTSGGAPRRSLRMEAAQDQLRWSAPPGEIEDVVLDPADRRIDYVLVSRGGFLGMGEELVAVRWQDLRATADHEIFVLDVPASAFEDAPAVDSTNFAQTASREWRQELDQFWNEHLKG